MRPTVSSGEGFFFFLLKPLSGGIIILYNNDSKIIIIIVITVGLLAGAAAVLVAVHSTSSPYRGGAVSTVVRFCRFGRARALALLTPGAVVVTLHYREYGLRLFFFFICSFVFFFSSKKFHQRHNIMSGANFVDTANERPKTTGVQ